MLTVLTVITEIEYTGLNGLFTAGRPNQGMVTLGRLEHVCPLWAQVLVDGTGVAWGGRRKGTERINERCLSAVWSWVGSALKLHVPYAPPDHLSSIYFTRTPAS